jgi:hypothetical protein
MPHPAANDNQQDCDDTTLAFLRLGRIGLTAARAGDIDGAAAVVVALAAIIGDAAAPEALQRSAQLTARRIGAICPAVMAEAMSRLMRDLGRAITVAGRTLADARRKTSDLDASLDRAGEALQ